MIKMHIIDKGTQIPAGTYYSRTAVLDLIIRRYGYKYTLHDMLITPFYYIEEWSTDSITLEAMTDLNSDSLIDYIKESIEPKVVTGYDRVFQKSINGNDFVIEANTDKNDNEQRFNLIVTSKDGERLVDQSFQTLEQAKDRILSII